MIDEPVGFGAAPLRQEGASYIWDDAIGNYREMTPDEIVAHRKIVAEWKIFRRTWRGKMMELGDRFRRAYRAFRGDRGL